MGKEPTVREALTVATCSARSPPSVATKGLRKRSESNTIKQPGLGGNCWQ